MERETALKKAINYSQLAMQTIDELEVVDEDFVISELENYQNSLKVFHRFLSSVHFGTAIKQEASDVALDAAGIIKTVLDKIDEFEDKGELPSSEGQSNSLKDDLLIANKKYLYFVINFVMSESESDQEIKLSKESAEILQDLQNNIAKYNEEITFESFSGIKFEDEEDTDADVDDDEDLIAWNPKAPKINQLEED